MKKMAAFLTSLLLVESWSGIQTSHSKVTFWVQSSTCSSA